MWILEGGLERGFCPQPHLLHSPICPLPVPVTTLFCPYQDSLLFHQPPSHPVHALTYNSGQQVPTVAWSQLVSLPWPAHTLLQGALTLSLLIKSLFCFLRDNIKRECKEKLIALLPFQHVCYCYTLLNCKWSMNIPLFLLTSINYCDCFLTTVVRHTERSATSSAAELGDWTYQAVFKNWYPTRGHQPHNRVYQCNGK